jgi:hypothetical protein
LLGLSFTSSLGCAGAEEVAEEEDDDDAEEVAEEEDDDDAEEEEGPYGEGESYEVEPYEPQ